jgi:phage gp37-like protein
MIGIMNFVLHMIKRSVTHLATYAGEWAVDKIRDSVQPVPGSVVYCDFHIGFTEHSGIYIGDNKIVHLNGRGYIRAVSPFVFLKNTTASNIQVCCRDEFAVGSEEVAQRARSMVGKFHGYDMTSNNCHKFVVGCLTGSFENPHYLLRSLKPKAEQILHGNTWRLWDR